MKRTILFVLVATTLVIAAAFLAAPTTELLTGWGVVRDDPARPHHLFLKVFRRLLMFPLAAALLIWLRPWKDGTLSTWGLRGPSVHVRPAALAWLVTVGLGALLYGLRFANGWHVAETGLGAAKILGRLAGAFAVGLVVGLIEEWFFRAWLWTKFGRARAPLRSALLTSAVYAALHGFRPGALDDLDVAHDASGALAALGHWLRFLTDIPAFGPSFLGLFLLGMLLSGLYRRTGNLLVAVAVHAAGIFLLKGHEALLDAVRGADVPAGAGTQRLYDGLPGWIVLALAGLLAWRLGPRGQTEGGGAGSPAPRAG